MEKIVSDYGIPFHYVEVIKDGKEKAEAKMFDILNEDNIDLIILARYMQILSNDFVKNTMAKLLTFITLFYPVLKELNLIIRLILKRVKSWSWLIMLLANLTKAL